ncbi:hypothetical protein [Streptomyces cahuitamycinicus]|uniref:Uncharacterized protein n=1 Tax=Streptomyces cahuitamycinicus TaxID=2070367 RepID=A0A2N8TK44_9ACTN|nr:hypothetical protein [Streptomyces cahuitamycinicus]PNG19373.1 hypothetical protein C1J00_26035 [Streptomyces cahuitamycinicus]
MTSLLEGRTIAEVDRLLDTGATVIVIDHDTDLIRSGRSTEGTRQRPPAPKLPVAHPYQV